MNRVALWSVVLGLTLAFGCSRKQEAGQGGHGHEGHGHEGPEAPAAAPGQPEQCEHGIPIRDCNECRYEAGAVKVDPGLEKRLIEEFKAAGPVQGFATLALQCRVGLDESRTVDLRARVAGVLEEAHGGPGDKPTGVPMGVGVEVRAGQELASLRGAALPALEQEHQASHRELELAGARNQRLLERSQSLGQLLTELRAAELGPELLKKLAALPEGGQTKGDILDAAAGLWRAREDHRRELARVAGLAALTGARGSKGSARAGAGDWAGRLLQARSELTLAGTRLGLTKALLEGGAASRTETAEAEARQRSAKATFEALRSEARLEADRLMVEAEQQLAAAEARFSAVTEEAGLELAARKAALDGELAGAQARLEASHGGLGYLGLECEFPVGAPPAPLAPPVPSPLAPLLSPIAGTVVEWHTAPGNLVEDGELVGRVADLSRVWVWCEVHPADMALASRLALPAAAQVVAGDGAPMEARLDLLSPLLDEALGVFKARLVLDNPVGSLRPGMAVSATLKVPDAVPSVEIPGSAVLEDEGQAFVFVREGLLWVKRPVTVLATGGGRARISKGLGAGETVASRGAFYLKSDILREKMGAGCAD